MKDKELETLLELGVANLLATGAVARALAQNGVIQIDHVNDATLEVGNISTHGLVQQFLHLFWSSANSTTPASAAEIAQQLDQLLADSL